MSRLRIRHETLYSFPEPVAFGRWRLLTRPLDTHAVRLVDAWLETPPGEVSWTYDAHGNCVCYLQPMERSDQLRIVNHLLVQRYPAALWGCVASSANAMAPVVYAEADRRVLEPFIAPDTLDDDPRYRDWLASLAPDSEEPALVFLQRMNSAICDGFVYGVRDQPGTQTPAQTVASGSGACRDFAWLMVESARRQGFAARFVTGYLYCPDRAVKGAGATHAWCDVFLPGQGWTEFDPTNALVESSSLIRVATTRTWREADPVNGVVAGQVIGQLSVSVDVDLVSEEEGAARAA